MEVTFSSSYRYRRWPVVPALIVNPLNGERIDMNLVVDTGAEGTVLDRSIAQLLALALEPTSVQLTGLGGSIGAPSGEVDILVLAEPALRVRVTAVFVPNIGQSLGNLLGLDYFAGIDLGLSHANRALYFGTPA